MAVVDLDTAIFNPASIFKKPEEILLDTKIALTKEQKIRALQTWKYDIKLKQMAEEENMHSDQEANDTLLEDTIIQALKSLGAS
jgi:hypothetical protein